MTVVVSGFLESKAWGQELMPIAVLGRVTPGSRREEGMEVKQGRRQSRSQDVWSTWLPLGALERLPYPQGVSFKMAYKMQLRTAGPRGIGGRIYPQAPVSYWPVSTPKGCTHTHTHTQKQSHRHPALWWPQRSPRTRGQMRAAWSRGQAPSGSTLAKLITAHAELIATSVVRVAVEARSCSGVAESTPHQHSQHTPSLCPF